MPEIHRIQQLFGEVSSLLIVCEILHRFEATDIV